MALEFVKVEHSIAELYTIGLYLEGKNLGRINEPVFASHLIGVLEWLSTLPPRLENHAIFEMRRSDAWDRLLKEDDGWRYRVEPIEFFDNTSLHSVWSNDEIRFVWYDRDVEELFDAKCQVDELRAVIAMARANVPTQELNPSNT